MRSKSLASLVEAVRSIALQERAELADIEVHEQLIRTFLRSLFKPDATIIKLS